MMEVASQGGKLETEKSVTGCFADVIEPCLIASTIIYCIIYLLLKIMIWKDNKR